MSIEFSSSLEAKKSHSDDVDELPGLFRTANWPFIVLGYFRQCR